MLVKGTIDTLSNYVTLHNRYAKENYYLLMVSKAEVIDYRKESMDKGQYHIYYHRQGNQISGYIAFRIEKGHAFIEELYVMPRYRSLTNYKELLDAPNHVYKRGLIIHYTSPKEDDGMLRVLMRSNFKLKRYQLEMVKDNFKSYQIYQRLTCKKFYQVNDVEALNRFMCMVTKPAPNPYTIAEVQQMVVSGDDLKLIFFEDGMPIGFIVANINEQRNRQENREIIYIEEIAIGEKYRRLGHGKEMMMHIINRAIYHGMKEARLHVYTENKLAIQLYKSMGFHQVKTLGYWQK